MPGIERWCLSNGVKIPAIGFGVGSSWRLRKQELKLSPDSVMPELVESLKNALKVGFVHIDSAEIYLTRKELKQALVESGLARNDLFITDKHFCGAPQLPAFTDSPYDSILEVLKDLDTEYINLYLLHSSNIFYEKNQLSPEEQWADLEKAYNEGKVKAIGVSNYSVESLERIMKVAKIPPQVLQIEFHALCQNKTPGIIDYCKKHNIIVSAYAPLAPLTLVKEPNDLNRLLDTLSVKYNKTQAQILLRWVSQAGVVPITTSSKVDRLRDAQDIYSFKLSAEDFEQIKELGEANKTSFYNW